MEPNDMQQRDHNIHGVSNSGSVDPGFAVGNSELLFSTLRNLTKNSETAVTPNGFCNTTPPFSSFSVSLSDHKTNSCNSSADSTSTNSSSSWLDQAKLSLLPMYGMFQSSINPSEMYRTTNNLWMDSNIQQAAVAAVAFNAAASLNAMQNLPSFEQLGSASTEFSKMTDNFQQPNDDSKFGSPSNETLKSNLQSPQCGVVGFQRPTTSSCYSQSTASTAHTPQSAIGPSLQGQTMPFSPEQGQSIARFSNPQSNSNGPTVMEELSELDLQDFEDFLMEKPSTSCQMAPSQQSNFFTSTELEKIASAEKSIEYRADELTNVDIELDRLVSLVASQNNRQNIESHPFEGVIPEGQNKKADYSSVDTPVFELPQFTPPDSPSEGPSTSHFFAVRADNGKNKTSISEHLKSQMMNYSSTAIKKSPSSVGQDLVLIPKEIKLETTLNQSNKVPLARRNISKLPIYKQSLLQNDQKFSGRLDNDQQIPKRKSDAYSFEEDELTADVPASCSLTEILQSAKRSSEGHETKTTKDEDRHSKMTRRKYRKRHSSVVAMPTAKVAGKTSTVNSILVERAKLRARFGFVSSELANDDNSVLTDIPIPTCTMRGSSSDANFCSNSSNDAHSLPKLIIRIPKRENPANDEEIAQRHSVRKEKKRKKRDKDLDWTESSECHGTSTKERHHGEKRHRKSHRKRRKHSAESDEKPKLDFDLPCSSASLDQPNIPGEVHSRSSPASPLRNEPENADLLNRLNLFERPTERPRRGTFLLPKGDLFDSDCALWRIDNQNLLQKYLPITLDGVSCYHNSSTYSGWCEHYVDEYIAVRVEYIKQSRSENIVRPVIPLQDLFPATSFPVDDEETNDRKTMNDGFERSCTNVSDQQFWSYFNNFVKMMLKHAVSFQFIQHVRQNNDWTYLCALTEIESAVNRCVQNIRAKTSFWSSEFVDSLRFYPRINSVGKFDDGCFSNRCQACLSDGKDVSSAIQLFSFGEQFDYETMTPIPSSDCSDDPPSNQPTDFYVCAQCEHFALSFHRAFHLSFHVLKSAEEKLELFSAKYPDISLDELIIECLGDKMWLNKIAETVLNVQKMA